MAVVVTDASFELPVNSELADAGAAEAEPGRKLFAS